MWAFSITGMYFSSYGEELVQDQRFYSIHLPIPSMVNKLDAAAGVFVQCSLWCLDNLHGRPRIQSDNIRLSKRDIYTPVLRIWWFSNSQKHAFLIEPRRINWSPVLEKIQESITELKECSEAWCGPHKMSRAPNILRLYVYIHCTLTRQVIQGHSNEVQLIRAKVKNINTRHHHLGISHDDDTTSCPPVKTSWSNRIIKPRDLDQQRKLPFPWADSVVRDVPPVIGQSSWVEEILFKQTTIFHTRRSKGLNFPPKRDWQALAVPKVVRDPTKWLRSL